MRLPHSASRTRRGRRGAAFLAAVLALAVIGAIASVVLWRHGIRSRTQRDERAAARWASIRVVPRLPVARLASPLRVAVLDEPASDRWFNGPAALDTVTRAWISALGDIGADAQTVEPGDTESLRRVAVLVVPSSPCLSAAARSAVDSVLARGGGVLVTWLSGTRDAACGDAGYGFITRVALASRVDTLDRRPATRVTFPDGGVLSAGMPPGATFAVRGAHDGAVRRIGRDGYYSDGFLNPAPASAQPGVDGAVTHASVGQGRAVYWGFDIARIVDRPWDQAVARILLRNSIAWAGGEPLVSVAPWPGARQASVVVVQQVDDETNAPRALDTLRRAGVRATYLFATSAVRDQRDFARKLAGDGEVGSRPDDELRIARTEEEQTAKFRTMREELQGLVGNDVVGIMEPMERLDPLVTLAWARAGGRYVVAGNDARSAGPDVLAVDGVPLVLLPRLANDDAVAAASGRSADDDHRAALTKLRALGGLYLDRHHASLLDAPGRAAALGRSARTISADSGLWVATARDVAAWWMSRSQLAASVTSIGQDGITIRVANDGPAAVDGAVLRIVPNSGRRYGGVTGAMLLDSARAPGAGEVLAFRLPRLGARAIHAVEIRLLGGERADAR